MGVAALHRATSPLTRSLHGGLISAPRLLQQLPDQAPPGSDCLPSRGADRDDDDDGSLPSHRGSLDSDCRTSTGRLFCSAGLIIMTSPPRGSGTADSVVAGLRAHRQLLPGSDQRAARRAPPSPPPPHAIRDTDDEVRPDDDDHLLPAVLQPEAAPSIPPPEPAVFDGAGLQPAPGP